MSNISTVRSATQDRAVEYPCLGATWPLHKMIPTCISPSSEIALWYATAVIASSEASNYTWISLLMAPLKESSSLIYARLMFSSWKTEVMISRTPIQICLSQYHLSRIVTGATRPRISVDTSTLHYWGEVALLLRVHSQIHTAWKSTYVQVWQSPRTNWYVDFWLDWVLLTSVFSAKGDRFSRKRWSGTQFPFTSLWMLVSITSMNSLSSINRTILLSYS